MHGMHGTLDAELEVQRTIRRVELTAFFCLLRRIIVPTTAHVDNKGIIEWCVARRDAAKDADLWMLMWEEVRRTHDAGIRVGVEHVKAHRSKKAGNVALRALCHGRHWKDG